MLGELCSWPNLIDLSLEAIVECHHATCLPWLSGGQYTLIHKRHWNVWNDGVVATGQVTMTPRQLIEIECYSVLAIPVLLVYST